MTTIAWNNPLKCHIADARTTNEHDTYSIVLKRATVRHKKVNIVYFLISEQIFYKLPLGGL